MPPPGSVSLGASGVGIGEEGKRIAAVGVAAVRDVGRLLAERDRVDDRPRGGEEADLFAAAGELEVGVQGRRGGVLVVGPDEQEGAGCERRPVGDAPLHRLVDVVGQKRTAEVDRLSRGVVQLDPVAELAEVRVGERGLVGGQQLVDHDALSERGHRVRGQDQKKQRERLQ